MSDIVDLLAEQLKNPESSWSMGTYGAVAEFFQEPGETIDTGSSTELSCITPRGGIRLQLQEDIAICAHEKSSGNGGDTQQHIALCLPAAASRMSNASVLTERGPDSAALKDQDRDAVLFNLGVSAIGTGCFQVDFCVRTGDPDLIEFCRDHCGSNVFALGSMVLPRLLKAQPHRVVITRLGRIEVYQAIGGENTGGKSPEGPHTHLLPNLLQSNRTHSTSVPIKESWVPCAFLYSRSTVFTEPGDAHGEA